MALLNNGHYITVENVDSSGVVIRIHADEAHRAGYETLKTIPEFSEAIVV